MVGSKESTVKNLFEIILGRITGEPPGILQEVKWYHQEEAPWLHLCRKTRFMALSAELRSSITIMGFQTLQNCKTA